MRSGSLQSSSQFAQVQSYLRRARNSSLIQNAAWLFAGQGLSVIIQTLYFVVLARLLSTSQFGALAGAVALISVVSQYSALGAGTLMKTHRGGCTRLRCGHVPHCTLDSARCRPCLCRVGKCPALALSHPGAPLFSPQCG
jgi:hypothetical protein